MKPCADCHSLINPDAPVCPECGFDPRKDDKWSRALLRLISYALIVSIYGSIFGFPLLISSMIKNRKAKQRTAATYRR